MRFSLKSNIPPNRLVIYLSLALLLPLVITCSFWAREYKSWKSVAEELGEITYLSTLKSQKQSLNNLLKKKYAKADSLYLERRLKDFTPLEKERKALEKLTQNPSYIGTDVIEKRLLFLNQSNHPLSFTEKQTQAGDGFRESFEETTHSYEVDTEDLKSLLEILEQDHPLKPQLIIRDFHVVRKTKPGGNEIFDLHLALIKREYEAR